MDPDDTVLAALPMAALRIGPDDRVVLLNPAAQELFGPQALGRHFAIPLRQPEILDAIGRARAERRVQEAQMSLAQRAQDTVLQARVIPVGGSVVIVFQDQTALVQMDQMRRDFVANVSHELRTPLTSLLGFIETLRGPARDDPQARGRFLSIMAAEAERMRRLVQDLLHLSRVEAEERLRPGREEDLSLLAREAVSALGPMARAAGVELRLSGAEGAHRARADRDQILQVLSNLIENAVKYGSAQGGCVDIDLSREEGPRGQMLRLSVSDHGEGLDPRHLPRLTERFYRVDSHRSRAQGGTGLGLAIVKHIVNRHRGRLEIESVPGKGSRFSALLPMD